MAGRRRGFSTPNRPKTEPGFALDRQEAGSRKVRYTTRSYAVMKPEGERH